MTTILRWLIGIVTAFAFVGWLGTLMLYVVNGDDRYKELGTRLRQMVFTIALFWFNLEVWGRVVWTVVTWNRPGGPD